MRCWWHFMIPIACFLAMPFTSSLLQLGRLFHYLSMRTTTTEMCEMWRLTTRHNSFHDNDVCKMTKCWQKKCVRKCVNVSEIGSNFMCFDWWWWFGSGKWEGIGAMTTFSSAREFQPLQLQLPFSITFLEIVTRMSFPHSWMNCKLFNWKFVEKSEIPKTWENFQMSSQQTTNFFNYKLHFTFHISLLKWNNDSIYFLFSPQINYNIF